MKFYRFIHSAPNSPAVLMDLDLEKVETVRRVFVANENNVPTIAQVRVYLTGSLEPYIFQATEEMDTFLYNWDQWANATEAVKRPVPITPAPPTA